VGKEIELSCTERRNKQIEFEKEKEVGLICATGRKGKNVEIPHCSDGGKKKGGARPSSKKGWSSGGETRSYFPAITARGKNRFGITSGGKEGNRPTLKSKEKRSIAFNVGKRTFRCILLHDGQRESSKFFAYQIARISKKTACSTILGSCLCWAKRGELFEPRGGGGTRFCWGGKIGFFA